MIRAYVGLLGSGKTLSLVSEALRMFRLTIPQIYTDMASLRFPEAVYLSAEEPSALATVSQGLILLDEAQIIADARYWQKVPGDVLSAWAQLRKNGLDLLYTTQTFESVDARLRGLTAEVIRCKKFGPFVLQLSQVPGKKEILRKRIVRISPVAYHLYDTLEIVGRAVGLGAGQSSTMAELRAARSAKREARPQLRNGLEFFRSHSAPVYGGEYLRHLVLHPAARRSRDFLIEQGAMSEATVLWYDLVADELCRRSWLGSFGFSEDEIEQLPLTCSYSSPWLRGWSPREVAARVAISRRVDEWEEREQTRRRDSKTRILMQRDAA